MNLYVCRMYVYVYMTRFSVYTQPPNLPIQCELETKRNESERTGTELEPK